MLSVIRLYVVRLCVVAPSEPVLTPELGGFANPTLCLVRLKNIDPKLVHLNIVHP